MDGCDPSKRAKPTIRGLEVRRWYDNFREVSKVHQSDWSKTKEMLKDSWDLLSWKS